MSYSLVYVHLCVCVCVSACDSCVIVLLEDLDKLEDSLASVSQQLGSLNASAMAWTQLQNLNKTLEDVAVSESYTHTHAHFQLNTHSVELCACASRGKLRTTTAAWTAAATRPASLKRSPGPSGTTWTSYK